MLKSTYYRWCMVPNCKNTTIKTPDKTFIQVPKNAKRTKLWCQAARRDFAFYETSSVFVCEDHFDLEKDMKNYRKWKLMGNVKICMKETVVPHKFDCQPDRKRAFSTIPRAVAVKRNKAQLVQEALMLEKAANVTATSTVAEEPVESLMYVHFTKEGNNNRTNVGVTVNIRPVFRSKHTQTTTKFACKGCSPIKVSTVPVATSPIKNQSFQSVRKKTESLTSLSETSSTEMATSGSQYRQSSSSTSGSEMQTVMDEMYAENNSKLARHHTVGIIKMRPRFYLGVPQECMFIINLIEKYTLLGTISIYVALQKIRLNQTFLELGDAYGHLESSTSRYFSKSVTLISQLMKEFIISPAKEKIQELLPLPFMTRYGQVQYIIDCLEIEIQKPSDAIKQALTWSEYKKANTLKYLISSTPNGIITFISDGFGGRASDTIIIEKSGFLDKLQQGSVIMADRGFKHIEHLLINKNCKLLRPPSVNSGQKLSKTEAIETKRIASLRIHIERVIRRLREYKLLKPHSCVSGKLIPYMDDVIASGLVNLQAPLIK